MFAMRLYSICKISFNRYMVECELYLFASSTFIDKSFNRYMVECESVYHKLIFFVDKF